MRIPLYITLGLASLWDGFTTLFGTNQILGASDNYATVVISTLFGLLILVFMVSIPFLLNGGLIGVTSIILKILLPIAVGYDLYTSYIGNTYFILEGNVNAVQNIIIIGITLFVSSAPVIFSLLVSEGY